jgi:signal peptidase II
LNRGAALAAFAALLGADLASKAWVRAHVPVGRDTVLVRGAFDLTHAPNRGIAFSALAGLPDLVRVPLLVAAPVVATAMVFAYTARAFSTLRTSSRLALVLVLAGAVGNLSDRLRLGAVTDFVRWRIGARTLFVNNLADDYISVGAALLALGMMMPWRPPSPERSGPSTTTDSDPRS